MFSDQQPFINLYRDSMAMLRFSAEGVVSMSHLTTHCGDDGGRASDMDERFGVRVRNEMRCECRTEGMTIKQCSRAMLDSYKARRSQSLANHQAIGEVLNLTGDFCKAGRSDGERCFSSSCSRVGAACPTNWLDFKNFPNDQTYIPVAPGIIWHAQGLSIRAGPGIGHFNDAHFLLGLQDRPPHLNNIQSMLFFFEGTNQNPGNLRGIQTIYVQGSRPLFRTHGSTDSSLTQRRYFPNDSRLTVSAVEIHRRGSVVSGIRFIDSSRSGSSLFGRTGTATRFPISSGNRVKALFGDYQRNAFRNLGIFSGPEASACCDDGRVCEGPEDVDCWMVRRDICRDGVLDGSKNVCCPKACGSCGGSRCNDRPGGADQCCAGNIRSRGNSCVLPGDVGCVRGESPGDI